VVLDSAAQLARAFGAELLLCRVVQPVPLPADPILPVTIAYDTELTEQLLGGSDDYLARVAERFAGTGVPLRRRSLVGHGVAPTLIEAARDEGAGLIVMTTCARPARQRRRQGDAWRALPRAALPAPEAVIA
jgi:nucleotide-binding universal stress UspA family protein